MVVAPVKVLGTNLVGTGNSNGGLAEWESEQPFANLFKQSRSWISTDGIAWSDSRGITLDADGNPLSLLAGQMLRVLFYWALPAGAHPIGPHILTWTGSGTFTAFQGATVASSAPNKVVLNVTDGGLGLMLSGIDPANPPKNFKLVVQANKDPVWNDAFLASLAPYKAIRFMDWMGTNGSALVNPADLPAPTKVRYDQGGVPLEDIIALCNQLKVQPWICVPHQATDALVSAMADKVLKLLDPALSVTVEYSNEVWNSGFPQASYAQAQGVAAKLDPAPYSAQMLWHAQRTAQVGKLFKAKLGARAIVTLGAQAVNSWWIDTMLGSQPAGSYDAVAIAPYFGYELGTQAATPTMTLDALFAALTADVVATGPVLQAALAAAQKHGVKLVCYESGQHLVGVGALQTNAAINSLFDQANADPRMGQLYTQYLNLWQSTVPGGLICHYANIGGWGQSGRWGSMKHPTDLASPKRVALAAWATA